MIRFVYFDLGNVLLHFSHERMCRQVAAASGADEQSVRAWLISEEVLQTYETGRWTPAEHWHAFCQNTGTNLPETAFHEAASDIFTVNEPMIPIVDRLQRAGYETGILSNTNQAHWDFVTDGRYSPLLPGSFQSIILSCAVGAMKPHSAIYRAAQEQAGVDPHEVLFTDDRPENVEGARQAGLNAIQFHTAETFLEQLPQFEILLPQ